MIDTIELKASVIRHEAILEAARKTRCWYLMLRNQEPPLRLPAEAEIDILEEMGLFDKVLHRTRGPFDRIVDRQGRRIYFGDEPVDG